MRLLVAGILIVCVIVVASILIKASLNALEEWRKRNSDYEISEGSSNWSHQVWVGDRKNPRTFLIGAIPHEDREFDMKLYEARAQAHERKFALNNDK